MDWLHWFLKGKKDDKQRIEYLKKWHPTLYVYAMGDCGRDEDMKEYMEKCKKYENDDDFSKYSLYIFGYWLPYLEELKKKGLLNEGQSVDFNLSYSYRHCNI